MATNTDSKIVPWETLFRITGIVLLLFFCWYFKQIIVIFIGALVLSTSLEGLVNWAQKIVRKRLISVILIYLLLLAIMGFMVYSIIPVLLNNLVDLINEFPSLLERPEISRLVSKYVSEESLAGDFLNTSNLLNYTKDIFKNMGVFFASFANVLLTLLISFYISLDKDWFRKFIDIVSPKKYREYLFVLWEKSERKMRFWLYSQIVISVLIGLVTFVVLYLLGVKLALMGALLNGLLEFIPFIGPILATLIILVINVNMGLPSLFLILISLLIIQYAENIISPMVRGKILNINPLVVIFSLAVGAKLGGAIGIFIAVPLSTILVEFIKDLSCQKFPNASWCKINKE